MESEGAGLDERNPRPEHVSEAARKGILVPACRKRRRVMRYGILMVQRKARLNIGLVVLSCMAAMGRAGGHQAWAQSVSAHTGKAMMADERRDKNDLKAVQEAQRGVELAHQGRYEEAIVHYRAAAKLDPTLPGIHLDLGLAYFKMKKLNEAASALARAVRASPRNFQARALLGMCYYGLRKFADAAVQLKQASRDQPGNVQLHYLLAQSYLWSQQYQSAASEFRFLLEKDPDAAAVHMLLGEALDGLGRDDEAIREFRAAVGASPPAPQAHFALGYVYWRQRKFAEACPQFEAQLDTEPDDTQSLTYLGDCEMKLGDTQKAEKHLRQALKLGAKLHIGELDLGILLVRQGQKAEAERHFREAIRLDPSDPDAHYHLGRLLISMGRRKEAAEEFTQVRKLAEKKSPPPLAGRMGGASGEHK